MKNDWRIRLRIVDRKLKREHKKSRIVDLDIEVPAELLSDVSKMIYFEFKKLVDRKVKDLK